ncbi:unnamed protein product [Chrysoparadoxa australica]
MILPRLHSISGGDDATATQPTSIILRIHRALDEKMNIIHMQFLHGGIAHPSIVQLQHLPHV